MNYELPTSDSKTEELAEYIKNTWEKADELNLPIDERIELLVGALVWLKGKIVDF